MTTSDDRLWIHQESAIITAEFHDVWGLTPEFLSDGSVVPNSWTCVRSSRSPDRVDIQFGPSHWSMDKDELRVTTYPDQPLTAEADITFTASEDDGGERGPIVPVSAHNFLTATPVLPSRKLWFFWRISALHQDGDQWLRERFLNMEWPDELGTIRPQPRLVISIGELYLEVTVSNEAQQRRHGDTPASITFDCIISRGVDLLVEDMILEVRHRTEWLALVDRTLQQLLDGGTQNATN